MHTHDTKWFWPRIAWPSLYPTSSLQSNKCTHQWHRMALSVSHIISTIKQVYTSVASHGPLCIPHHLYNQTSVHISGIAWPSLYPTSSLQSNKCTHQWHRMALSVSHIISTIKQVYTSVTSHGPLCIPHHLYNQTSVQISGIAGFI